MDRPIISLEKRNPSNGHYYDDAIESHLAQAMISDVVISAWSDPYVPSRMVGLHKDAKQLFEIDSYCLVADMPAISSFESSFLMHGYKKSSQICIEAAFAEAPQNEVTDIVITFFNILLLKAGNFMEVVSIGDDISALNDTFVSPKCTTSLSSPSKSRCMFLPIQKIMENYSISPAALSTVLYQTSLRKEWISYIQYKPAPLHMDLATLKSKFSCDIYFLGGGIDILNQLLFFFLEQIKDIVDHHGHSGTGRWLCILPHSIQVDVNSRCIDRMLTVLTHYINTCHTGDH